MNVKDPVQSRRSSVAVRGWIDRVGVPELQRSMWLAVVIVCAGFALSYTATAVFGSQSVSTTWYVPFILVAAARFRYAGRCSPPVSRLVLPLQGDSRSGASRLSSVTHTDALIVRDLTPTLLRVSR